MAVLTPKPPTESSADRFMLRLLRLPVERSGTDAQAQSAFQKSIAVSALRCLITYIFLPFVAPTISFFATFGPVLGIVVSVVAIVSITMSMRRFWRVRHGQRWAYTVLGGVMFCFIIFLLVRDIAAL